MDRDDPTKPTLYAAGLWAFLPLLLFLALAHLLLYGDSSDKDVPLGPLEMPLWMVFVLLYPMALSGILNLLALVLLGLGTYRTRRFPLAVAGGMVAALAGIGLRENVPFSEAFLYVGVGLTALPLRPWLVAAAVPAVLGVLVGEHAEWGRLLTSAGAACMCVMLVLAGLDELSRSRSARHAAT